MKKGILLFTLLFSANLAYSQLLLVENFDYPSGDSITQHGWVAHSGATNMVIVSPGLTYTGYPSSGIGNAVKLDTVGVSGMDVNKNFPADSSGSVYASYMIRVLYAAPAGGEYYFHLGNTVLGTTFRPKLFVKDSSGSVSFGISKGSNTGTFTPGAYLYNTTYLIVVKYTFVAGTSNDIVSMFVFTSPALPLTEPGTPTIGPLTDATQSDLGNAGTVALRQGVNTARPIAILDGIRITKSWTAIVPVEKISSNAGTYSLEQNFPNPFNPYTFVEFEIPRPSYVTLVIFDELGRETANLINENLSAGEHVIKFDASGLPSGAYFYRLTAYDLATGEKFTDSKSMVLVK